jgi:hypothetical protein
VAHHNSDASTHQPPQGGERLAEDRGKATTIHQLVRDGGRAASALVHDRLDNNYDAHDTSSAIGMDVRSREERQATATTPIMAATMTVVRTEARAPHR